MHEVTWAMLAARASRDQHEVEVHRASFAGVHALPEQLSYHTGLPTPIHGNSDP